MMMTKDLCPKDFLNYVGLKPWLEDSLQRAHLMYFTLCTELLTNQKSPFGLMAQNGLLLNQQTENWLYQNDISQYSINYQKGMRPILESYIDNTISPNLSDKEKVIKLSQSIDNLPNIYGETPYFLYGESDEETLLKGGGHCSCKARLLTALCQVLGVPARPILMWTWESEDRPNEQLGGHTVTEVYLNGKWSFFDPQTHLYVTDQNGELFSIKELRSNPKLLTEMPSPLLQQIQPKITNPKYPTLESFINFYADSYFDIRCPTSFSRHDVNEPYQGRWNWRTKEFREALNHDLEKNKEIVLSWANSGELTEKNYKLSCKEFRNMVSFKDWKCPIIW